MQPRNTVRMAVIGTGAMGAAHARDIVALDSAELVAVCDRNRHKADDLAAELGVRAFDDVHDLLDAPDLDAIVIATPHYGHPAVAIAAFEKHVHVLVEKPIAVHVNDGRRMIAAFEKARAARPDLKFAVMFMQRTYGQWMKIKDLIASGELGQLLRTTWVITTWFRTQSYYDHGSWRATWKGEGGGVLLNQAPHNLDLYQWLVGMPSRVSGYAAFGKYHAIEVEDEVTGFFEHANGMIGHFITSTAESPGTDRLEIVGENGTLIYERDGLTLYRNRQSMLKQIRESTQAFEPVECSTIDVPYVKSEMPSHVNITRNFVDAILHDAPLIVPAPEGLNSLMLGNAIILSAHRRQPVDLPLDGDAYEALLEKLIGESNGSRGR